MLEAGILLRVLWLCSLQVTFMATLHYYHGDTRRAPSHDHTRNGDRSNGGAETPAGRATSDFKNKTLQILEIRGNNNIYILFMVKKICYGDGNEM